MIRKANCFVRSFKSFSAFIILISNLVRGDAFADSVRELADDGPDGLLGIIRDQRQVEAHQLVVGPGELEGLLARADLGGDAVQLVVEDVAEALGEDEGGM